MKVAIFSSASAGGAGIAAYRIYEALSEASELEVDFLDIATLGQLSQTVSPNYSASNGRITNTHFTVDYATEPRRWLVDFLAGYDVLNVQWASYLMSLSEILELAKRGKQILFTLHDFYYITGGCHYPAGCLGFLDNCVGCPQVDERKCDQHTVINTLKLKRKIFSYDNVHLAAPSAFIVNSAIRSDIIPKHRGHVLRNAYRPIEKFQPIEWGNKRSILLIADSFDERRKGLQLAVDSLKLVLADEGVKPYKVELHLVGGMDKEVISQLNSSQVHIVTHGHIKQHKNLVEIFKKCQFILTCSYEDNWPNILVEAGSYGCIPIVGRWHGNEEFVRTLDFGIISENYTAHKFHIAIRSAIDNFSTTKKDLPKKVKKIREMHSYKTARTQYINNIKNTEIKENFIKNNKDENILSSNYLITKLNKKHKYEIEIIDTPFGIQGDKKSIDFDSSDLSKNLPHVWGKNTYGITCFRIKNVSLKRLKYNEKIK
ncbi:MAG: glycosyltransferase [Desulfobulbus sp.]|nr:glycosyltransferase [Desulfobulbus sp.]